MNTTITTGKGHALKPGDYIRVNGATLEVVHATATALTVRPVPWWKRVWRQLTKKRTLFPVWKFLGYCGFFRYEGLRGMQPRWWPRARVRYHVGEISVPMAIGDACQYAEMFDGEIIEPGGEHDPFKGKP